MGKCCKFISHKSLIVNEKGATWLDTLSSVDMNSLPFGFYVNCHWCRTKENVFYRKARLLLYAFLHSWYLLSHEISLWRVQHPQQCFIKEHHEDSCIILLVTVSGCVWIEAVWGHSTREQKVVEMCKTFLTWCTVTLMSCAALWLDGCDVASINCVMKCR